MKRRPWAAVLIAVFLLMSLSACRSSLRTSVTPPPASPSPTEEKTASPTPYPTDAGAPDVIGLYVKDREAGVRRLVKDRFVSEWIEQQDIECFEAFATNGENIPAGKYPPLWNSYWDSFPNSAAYKVGYELTLLYQSGETASQRVLGPADTHCFWQCVEIYLYDDVHQPGDQWYSHLNPEDMRDDTLCSSIKLTPGAEIDTVSAMKLTVFIYRNEEDLAHADGEYSNLTHYSIDLNRP